MQLCRLKSVLGKAAAVGSPTAALLRPLADFPPQVISVQHTIDRREVEAKRALPKEESPVSKDQQAAASGQVGARGRRRGQDQRGWLLPAAPDLPVAASWGFEAVLAPIPAQCV